jgi:hypothetical protein
MQPTHAHNCAIWLFPLLFDEGEKSVQKPSVYNSVYMDRFITIRDDINKKAKIFLVVRDTDKRELGNHSDL